MPRSTPRDPWSVLAALGAWVGRLGAWAGRFGARAGRPGAWAGRLGTVAARLRTGVVRRFGVDPRALAALRVSLGLLLLADLLRRSGDLAAFYTDAGVLPRTALAGEFPALARISLHTVSGAAWAQGLLFLVAAGFALALALGYRTRVAAVASWVLLASLHARNPVLVHGGDSLLRRILFWGAFLPLSARWSVDALRARRADDAGTADGEPPTDGEPPADDPVATVATAALLVQVVVVYTVNGLFKLRGDLWLRGEAVRYVFGLDRLTVLAGDVLAGYPALLAPLDWLWLGMVLAAALLVVLTGRARALFAGLFVAAHLGMALTLRLGLFPLVSVAALVPFLPGPVWDAAERAGAALRSRLVAHATARRWLVRHAGRPGGLARQSHGVARRLSGVARRLSGVAGRQWGAATRLRRVAGRLRTRPVSARQLRHVCRRAGRAAVAGLLAVVLVWNAATLGYVGLPDGVASAVAPNEHRWDMFAPEPRQVEGWFVVPGRLESGARVDAFRGAPVRWDRPPDPPDVRWWKYLVDVRRARGDGLRRQFAGYLCRRWNARHDDDLVRLGLYYVEERTRLDGPDPTRRVKLLEHSCDGSAA